MEPALGSAVLDVCLVLPWADIVCSTTIAILPTTVLLANVLPPVFVVVFVVGGVRSTGLCVGRSASLSWMPWHGPFPPCPPPSPPHQQPNDKNSKAHEVQLAIPARNLCLVPFICYLLFLLLLAFRSALSFWVCSCAPCAWKFTLPFLNPAAKAIGRDTLCAAPSLWLATSLRTKAEAVTAWNGAIFEITHG